MTKLDRPVQRVTDSTYQGRALVVRLHRTHLEIRQYGRREVLPVDYQTLWEVACKLRYLAAQKAKAS